MKVTLTGIKADVGSIGGHLKPSQELVDAVRASVAKDGKGLVLDHFVSYTGDDVAILLTHEHGIDCDRIHKLAWDAFLAEMQGDQTSSAAPRPVRRPARRSARLIASRTADCIR